MYVYILFVFAALVPISYAVHKRRKFNLDVDPFSFKIKRVFDYSIEDSIKDMVDLFDSANAVIKIVGGELNSKVYDNDDIIRSMEDALKRGVLIRIISGPKIDGADGRLMELASKYRNQFFLNRLDKRATHHYRIIDNKRVYMEAYHAELQRDHRNSILIDDTKYVGKNLEREFDNLATTCRSINPDNYLKEYDVLN